MWGRLVWRQIIVLIAVLVSLVFEVDCMLSIPLGERLPTFYHDFINMKLPTKYQCMELCATFVLCRSISYRSSDNMCILYSDYKDRQAVFTSVQEVFSRTNIPQGIAPGSCTTGSCGIDEMCVADAKTPTCVKHGKSIVKCPLTSVRKDNNCYKLFAEKKTWNEAREFCLDEGASLVEIHSLDFDSYLAVITYALMTVFGVNGEGAFWTGLVYSSPQSAWIWDGSGDTLLSTSFNRFSPTIPTSQDGMCMGVSYVNKSVVRTWKSVECNTKDVFICQYESPDFWP